MIVPESSNLYRLVKRMLKLMSKNSRFNVKNGVNMHINSVLQYITYFK